MVPIAARDIAAVLGGLLVVTAAVSEIGTLIWSYETALNQSRFGNMRFVSAITLSIRSAMS